MRGAVHQPLAALSARSAASSSTRRAAAEADLVQPHARADQHRERARRDLGVERAGVAGLDAVELGAAVGDQPGEEVEPAGRALGVGDRRDVARQRQPLDQRHDVDAALLQHRAGAEVDAVHLEVGEPLGERRARRAGTRRAPGRPRRPRRRSRLAGWTWPGASGAAGGDRARRRACARCPAPGSRPAGSAAACGGYGRASEIRTHDLSTPSRTRYQTAL